MEQAAKEVLAFLWALVRLLLVGGTLSFVAYFFAYGVTSGIRDAMRSYEKRG